MSKSLLCCGDSKEVFLVPMAGGKHHLQGHLHVYAAWQECHTNSILYFDAMFYSWADFVEKIHSPNDGKLHPHTLRVSLSWCPGNSLPWLVRLSDFQLLLSKKYCYSSYLPSHWRFWLVRSSGLMSCRSAFLLVVGSLSHQVVQKMMGLQRDFWKGVLGDLGRCHLSCIFKIFL